MSEERATRYHLRRREFLNEDPELPAFIIGVVEDTRKGIETLEELDPVSQDMLIGHAAELEKFQWFVRAHLENSGGELITEGASTEKSAASKAKTKK